MSLFSRQKRQDRDAAARLYRKIVDQARNAEFYTSFGVPDTAQGRFEMIVLHVFAVLHRLVRTADGDAEYARLLTEAFVADLDDNLREMGVGDLSVGKKVKGLYAAYGGRIGAYDLAISGEGVSAAALGNGDALEAAVGRNIYAGSGPQDGPGRMAGYVRRLVAGLRGVPKDAIRRSAFEFENPAGDGPERIRS